MPCRQLFSKKSNFFHPRHQSASHFLAQSEVKTEVRPLDKGLFRVIYLHCHSTVINNFWSVLITILTATSVYKSATYVELLWLINKIINILDYEPQKTHLRG